VAVVVALLVIVLILLVAGSLVGLAFSLLWLVLTGLVIGALGRLVLPGRQEIGLLQTALIGIAASLLGGMIATALVGVAASLLGGILANLFDVGWFIQLIVAVLLAAVGISLFASSETRRRTV
jgi:uncharacterized membrane protein YeaQ/YmgE (transglycosylase-associated protein family)